ncbi:MAG: ABC transporter substrate-binding protein [Betaproteobacteria bacterium]
MMERRTFIGVAGSGFLGCVPIVGAQPAGKVWRVGFLASGARPQDGAPPRALRDALQVLGHAEGKDVTYEGRWSEGRNERLDGLTAELLARKVDLIVAFGGPAAEVAKRMTSTVPIVVFSAGDVVDTGLIPSLARPGGNITGVNDPAAVLSAKRLEILKELVPDAKRVAVLWNAGNYAMTLRYREIERAAQALRMSVEPLGVREPDDFDVALAAMASSPPDALMMVTDALTNLNRRRVLDFVGAHKIPAMYEFDFVVRAGGLISYGSDQGQILALAASYVSKVIKGGRPADLAVEQPNRYFLVINLKTAKALGLTVPQALLLRADEVI